MNQKDNRLQILLQDLNEIGCPVMAEKLAELHRSPRFLELDPLDFLLEIVQPQHESTSTSRYNGRLRRAKLEGSTAALASCTDSNERIYLPPGAVPVLRQLDFVENGLNLCIVGPSGSGKTYLAKALSVEACTQWRVLYCHCDGFLSQLVDLKEISNKQYERKIRSLANLDLLTIDDFLLQPVGSNKKVSVLFDLLDRRNELNHTTIVCSQRSPESWNAMMGGDAAIGDAIIRRATLHYTVVIEIPARD